MKSNRPLLKAAIATAIGASLSCASATAIAGEKMIKCYGVAKAGKNDCGTAKHACAGIAKKDYDPEEWKFMTQKACDEAKKNIKKKS